MYPDKWMRVEAFRHCLTQSARPHRDLPAGDEGYFGAGMLDTLALLLEPLPCADALERR